MIICLKPAPMLSQPDGGNSPDMLTLVSSLLSCRGKERTAGLIHRLDRNVGGVMLFSKHPSVSGALSGIISDKERCIKEYLAVVEGCPVESCGTLVDLLRHDSAQNKSFVENRERRGVKKASLEYSVIDTATYEGEIFSLLKIRLHTGRTHQIRVQFASRKNPIAGDRKYGSHTKGLTSPGTIALWAFRLALTLPDGKSVDVSGLPSASLPWSLFDIEKAVEFLS